MILDITKRQVILCILLGLSGISAMARVDNWSQRRPNNTYVAQNQRGQAGYQQPLPQSQWNRYNQTQGQSYNNHHHHQQQPQPQWQQHSNNRTQYNYQPSAPPANQNPWIRNNQTQYYAPQLAYDQRSYNKTQGWNQTFNSPPIRQGSSNPHANMFH